MAAIIATFDDRSVFQTNKSAAAEDYTMMFRDDGFSWASEACSGQLTERLLIKTYRCAIAGLSFGEARCWEIGSDLLGEIVAPEDVEPLFAHFYGFARALLAAAEKPLLCLPVSYPRLCLEETLAMRMIATAQCANYAGTLSAASTLLGDEELGGALEAAQSLASALARRGLLLHDALEPFESGRPPSVTAFSPRAKDVAC